MFLYEKLEKMKGEGKEREVQELPEVILENLNPSFELRPYQMDALRNFILYHKMEKTLNEPIQALFHMATGSGKTLIMASLMLYLYKEGYRNFLFFVNLGNILQKTKNNFLNKASGKYLFAQRLFMEGEEICIREVQNFQAVDPLAINICFTTTQGLHYDMRLLKENHMSLDDFDNQRIVLISDEAHHLNASTKRMSKEEESSYRSWEDTVKKLFESCKENLLLEFTATCDLNNPFIKEAYENKIVYDYPLKKFRQDLYSKEIVTLRSDLDRMDRALMALVLSQYRLKIFQRHGLSIKPVVLFKASKIADSREFMEEFETVLGRLEGRDLKRISLLMENPTMKMAYSFFEREGITLDMLSQELQMEFAPEHCVSVNEESDLEEKQLLLNSLEEEGNPYRAIFEVRKLDEGWDVLNLFDIVRLYETRQGGGKRISSATISEAQLIGRGARYCPFCVQSFQNRYQRKYDQDLSNELRICEELYYHCQNDSRYITELHQALREIGIETKGRVSEENRLKESFTQTSLYREGFVVMNERRKREPLKEELLSQIRGRSHSLFLATGLSGEDVVMDMEGAGETQDHHAGKKRGEQKEPGKEPPDKKVFCKEVTLRELAEINYSIPYKVVARYPALHFCELKKRFPELSSMREFLTADDYLGGVRLRIHSQYENPPVWVLTQALDRAVKTYQEILSPARQIYEGSRELFCMPLRKVFTDKVCSYHREEEKGGEGVSQRDLSVPEKLRLDLMEEPWFVYQDHFGTLLEKAFVVYFKGWYRALEEVFTSVYLIRNERQLPFFSLTEGRRLCPAFIILLQRQSEGGTEQLQVMVEALEEPFPGGESGSVELLKELEDASQGMEGFLREGEEGGREKTGPNNAPSDSPRKNTGEIWVKLLRLSFYEGRVLVSPFFVENAHLKSP